MTLKTRSRNYAYKLGETLAAHGYLVIIANHGSYYLITIEALK